MSLLEGLSPAVPLYYLLPFLAVVYFFFHICYSRIREHVLIHRLGVRATRIHGWLFGDIDLVFQMTYHASAARDMVYWDWAFRQPKNGTRTIEHPVAGQRYVMTADSENIKAVLATQFHDFGKGESFHQEWYPFLGDSIFSTDGELWHHSRQLIRPQFVKNRISDLHTFEKHVTKLISLMGGAGEGVDVASLFYRYSLDTAMDYLLAIDMDSLGQPQVEFATAFGEVQRLQNLMSRMGPLYRFFPKGKYMANVRKLNNFVEPIIEQTLRLDPAELKTKENQSFLHALAATGSRDRQFLRDQIVAVLLAGRDTTAGTLSFLFYELRRYPQIVARLRQEILDTLGTDRAPSYDDLKNMYYLQHCLNETLRLYPAVPFNMRYALKSTTIPSGGGADGKSPVAVLKGDPVIYSVISMQRLADTYPPPSATFASVDQFSPERWETWQPKPWQFIPFNGGPRICIGQQFALTEMAYTVVRILQNFERVDALGDIGENGTPLFKCEVVLSPAKEILTGFWRAKSQ